MARLAAVVCTETPSHSRGPGNIRVRVNFTTGAVRSAILATAGLLVWYPFTQHTLEKKLLNECGCYGGCCWTLWQVLCRSVKPFWNSLGFLVQAWKYTHSILLLIYSRKGEVAQNRTSGHNWSMSSKTQTWKHGQETNGDVNNLERRGLVQTRCSAMACWLLVNGTDSDESPTTSNIMTLHVSIWGIHPHYPPATQQYTQSHWENK